MKIKKFKTVDFLFIGVYAIVIVCVLMGALITGLKSEAKQYGKEAHIEEEFIPKRDDLIIEVEPEQKELIQKTVYKEETTIDTEEYDCEELNENEREEEPKISFNDRYANITITDEDIELMARIVFLEANVEPFAGQRMVVEVILNRVLHGDMGGSTIQDVIYAKNQFSTAKNVPIAKPTEQNYLAIYTALTETPITDIDVVFFAQRPHNDHVFCKIGGHYFCYKY